MASFSLLPLLSSLLLLTVNLVTCHGGTSINEGIKIVDKNSSNDCFRAAVYEHIIINKYTDAVTNETPNYYLQKSLGVYKQVADICGRNNVQLLVYPEDGLFVPEDRPDVYNYAEEIPVIDAENLVTPCTDARFDTSSGSPGILKTLSCLARDNGLYIVADIADKVPCQRTNAEVYKNSFAPKANETSKRAVDDGLCPEDGHFLYNTAVAFDSDGRLVLKYHKFHLFGEFQYNLPPKQEIAVLETPFGRFGVYICFDKMFKDPPIRLVEDFGVRNLILTTWWFDEMPFLMAPQIHSSFAETLNVNLIVSNIKRLKVASTGSGLYSGAKIIDYHHDTEENDGRPIILISDVPKDVGNVGVCPNHDKKRIHLDFMTDNGYNTTQYPISGFDYVVIRSDAISSFNRTICNGTLCCSLSGRPSKTKDCDGHNDEADEYLFGVSNQIRSSFLSTGYEWCEETCVLSLLDKNWRENGRLGKVSKTRFENLVVQGTGFTTKYVYPSILGDNYKLITDKHVKRSDNEVSVSLAPDVQKNILMAGLYGRCYEKDPKYVRDHFNHKPILVPDF